MGMGGGDRKPEQDDLAQNRNPLQQRPLVRVWPTISSTKFLPG
jgi:hypothetical protein